jgi:hypothetical protein
MMKNILFPVGPLAIKKSLESVNIFDYTEISYKSATITPLKSHVIIYGKHS